MNAASRRCLRRRSLGRSCQICSRASSRRRHTDARRVSGKPQPVEREVFVCRNNALSCLDSLEVRRPRHRGNSAQASGFAGDFPAVAPITRGDSRRLAAEVGSAHPPPSGDRLLLIARIARPWRRVEEAGRTSTERAASRGAIAARQRRRTWTYSSVDRCPTRVPPRSHRSRAARLRAQLPRAERRRAQLGVFAGVLLAPAVRRRRPTRKTSMLWLRVASGRTFLHSA